MDTDSWSGKMGSSTLLIVVSLLALFSLSVQLGFAQAPGPAFNQIQFVVTTGDDDLRGDSSATATLQESNGSTLQVITLKAQNQAGWGNNTTHTVAAALNPPRPLSAIGHIVITLQSHNGAFESDDNWNVQSVVVTLSNNGGGSTELVSSSGDPLKRLTGSDPSLSLTPPPKAPPGSFNQIRFVIGTGDDDLRGDSSATATLKAANGSTLQVISLKAQKEPGWGNNTTHTVNAELTRALTASAIVHIVITLTSHNSFGETNDNWNVQSVTVALLNNGAGQKELMSFSGAPLARLTGSQPSLTLPEEATGAVGTFNQIQFSVTTGGDDLRGDSSATATLESPNGSTLQELTLKSQSEPGWGNNTSHTISLGLSPPRTPCAIGHILIKLTSHNSFGETNDNWNVQGVNVTLSNNGVGQQELTSGSGNPLARLTGDLPSLVLEGPDCMANVLGPQPGTGRLKGFVDLHTHPLSNVGFGGKLIYGGMDVGALLPADPDCNKDVRATSMEQALGHDGSTHGSFGVGGPTSAGGLGIQNSCGDFIREQVIHQVQQQNKGAQDESSDAHGAPDFKEWPVWNDITHQKMWVDWIHRAYLGGLRVMVALAVNNKTLGDMTAGPGDFATDDKSSADLQIAEIKSFVSRHSDFMEIASSSADLERIVRANKLAVVLGVEIDNIGNLNKVSPLTNAEIVTEVNRLFGEGVRYIFPIHLIDNPFGGTAIYQDIFNYSNFREAGHWWEPICAPNINHTFAPIGGALFTAGVLAKLGAVFNPPTYPACPNGTGQVNSRGLTSQGEFAIKEMMRHGMLIDIDHMSDKSQTTTIQIATQVLGGYPLNSGHSALRETGGNERSMTAAHYEDIGKLHGMAGIGSAGVDAYTWAEQYRQAIGAMGNGAIAGFGTDTDGLAMGMPHRAGSSVRYDDAFPRSTLGTQWWNYNKDGVAHYGMLTDFLKDVRTAPASGPGALNGADLVDNHLMFGADYFVQTWKKCEELKTKVQ